MRSIKHLVVLLLLVFSTQYANGQAAILAALFGDKVASEKFNLSMEIGIPLNNFSNLDNTKVKNGINFGIAGNIKLSENWFLSPTAYFLSKRVVGLDNYSLSSSDVDLNALYSNTSAKLTASYIDVPIFIYYQPTNSNIRLGIAPQISFLRSANINYEGGLGDFGQSIKGNVNKTDYGAIFNLGYYFKVSRKGKGLILSARYYQGFADVFDNTLFPENNTSNYFSLHFSLPFITDQLAQKNIDEN